MADEKILGVVSGTRDGKLLVVTTPTRCDEPATGEVYMGLVSGTRNGKPLVAISTQRCDPDDELTDGQTYLGLVSGTRNGKPLLVVPCGNCDGGGGDCPGCIPCEEDDDCVEIPPTLVLSVNSLDVPGIPTDDPDFLGDFTLTYLEDELVSRDVDEFCADTNITYGTGWFSDWFANDTVFPGAMAEFRYYFFGCTGDFAIHYKALDGLGCYLEEPYVHVPDNFTTTLGLVDCDPFLMTVSSAEITGSVSEVEE